MQLMPGDSDDTAKLEAAVHKRVLVVDDSPPVRHVLCRMLQALSVDVLEVGSGSEALGVLGRERLVGLILLDMNMPDMSGLDLLRTLRAGEELAPVPVVVLAGSGPDASIVEARELGAVGWLQKPVRMEALEALVERYLK